MLEADVLYAFVKERDWLKPVAERLLELVEEGFFGDVYACREVFHELYYVSMEEGVTLDEYMARVAALTSINHLVFLETSWEIDFLALTLMKQYGLTSIFDAYYAATALSMDPERTIVSTDRVYDRVPGLRRIDPSELIVQVKR